MQAKTVSHVLVWSRWLRLAHWSMAISVLGLVATGWLMSEDSLVSNSAKEIHYLLGGLLLPALLLRLYLLFFGSGTELLADCEPNAHRLSQAWQVLRFYLTLGKAPLPKWFSHNPLWGPFYIALFFVLTLAVASGLMLLNDQPFIGSLSLIDLHRLSDQVVFYFSLLHIPAVFAHDLASRSDDISGMVNGFKVFDAVENRSGRQESGQQAVSIDTLLKQLKK